MKWLFYDFIAGCVGGACGVCIGHPLDTIKTWQQASNTKALTAVYEIVKRNHGINGFYRGMLFPIVTTGAINSILFGVYGNHLRQLQKICHSDYEREKNEYRNIFVAGSIAGFVSSFIACPMELVKVRLQTHRFFYRRDDVNAQKKKPWDCLTTILRTDGISGLYRGLLPMMCRDVFPYGIYMLAYQRTIKFLDELNYVKRRRQKRTTTDKEFEITLTTIAGALAGVLSWVVVIPFDVIKTIIQAEEDPKRYQNMHHCIRTNIASHGWQILFRGSWILLARAIPVNAATFLGYEYAMQYFQSI